MNYNIKLTLGLLLFFGSIIVIALIKANRNLNKLNKNNKLNNSIMKDQTFLFHEKETNSKGQRRTFAGKISNGVMSIGVSTCGRNDQFIKERGRVIALGRADKKPSVTVTIDNNTDIRELFFSTVKSL